MRSPIGHIFRRQFPATLFNQSSCPSELHSLVERRRAAIGGKMTILITGSSGLIGRHLTPSLLSSGFPIRQFDIARFPSEDVRHEGAVRKALDGVSGVVLLAAVSRVIRAENDPAACISTNVGALRGVLRLCLEQKRRPWVLFASSREVYGDAKRFPVCESAPLQPVNLYARSKVKGEALVRAASEAGLMANIFRLSSVYGCPLDHRDRVTMAFAGAAAWGGRIRLEGRDNTFDFTSVQDVVRGLTQLVKATAAGEILPPIHFVSGKGTTLADLARMACEHARRPVITEDAPPRAFDVARFVGDPGRAQTFLGWRTSIDIKDGLPALIGELAAVPDAQAAGTPHLFSASCVA
jgi:nucleoside-diphosphate-sugar epimerase